MKTENYLTDQFKIIKNILKKRKTVLKDTNRKKNKQTNKYTHDENKYYYSSTEKINRERIERDREIGKPKRHVRWMKNGGTHAKSKISGIKTNAHEKPRHFIHTNTHTTDEHRGITCIPLISIQVFAEMYQIDCLFLCVRVFNMVRNFSSSF